MRAMLSRLRRGQGVGRVAIAVLLLLLGLLTPAHAIGPIPASPDQGERLPPTVEPAPSVALVCLAVYRAQGPPDGLHPRINTSPNSDSRVDSDRDVWVIVVVTFRADRSAVANWYAYAGGDPVNRWDPSGLDWVSADGNDVYYYHEYDSLWPGRQYSHKTRIGSVNSGGLVRIDSEDMRSFMQRAGRNPDDYMYASIESLNNAVETDRSGVHKRQSRRFASILTGLAQSRHTFGPQQGFWGHLGDEWSSRSRSVARGAGTAGKTFVWETLATTYDLEQAIFNRGNFRPTSTIGKLKSSGQADAGDIVIEMVKAPVKIPYAFGEQVRMNITGESNAEALGESAFNMSLYIATLRSAKINGYDLNLNDVGAAAVTAVKTYGSFVKNAPSVAEAAVASLRHRSVGQYLNALRNKGMCFQKKWHLWAKLHLMGQYSYNQGLEWLGD